VTLSRIECHLSGMTDYKDEVFSRDVHLLALQGYIAVSIERPVPSEGSLAEA